MDSIPFFATLSELLENIGVRHLRNVLLVCDQTHELTPGFRVPRVLCEYIHSITSKRFLTCFNKFLPIDECYIVNKKLVFCEENQGVVYWGVTDAAISSDPPVFQGNPDESRWYPEDKRLSTFLVKQTCWQAVNGWMRVRHTVNLPKKVAKQRFADLTAICASESTPKEDFVAYVTKGLCVCVAFHGHWALVVVGGSTRRLVNDFCAYYGLDMRSN